MPVGVCNPDRNVGCFNSFQNVKVVIGFMAFVWSKTALAVLKG